MLKRANGKLEPFTRDTLLISLYKSLAHRKTADNDASALCSTVISTLQRQTGSGAIIDVNALIQAASSCLERFDGAAGSHYRAYHPLSN
ncbi:hypothetical protein BH09PAT4_BH09PAT4_08400 [soil metagenome]